MKQMHLAILAVGLLITVTGGSARAALTTIGTATYNGSDYKLIWDDNNNGNSLIWLDYTNGPDTLPNQMYSWARYLDGALTYHIDPTYTVTWDDSAWRLPTTAGGNTYDSVPTSYDGSTVKGYNITSSEMGHLYYAELGNLGQYDTSGNPQSGYGLTNTGDFDHLVAGTYFSSTGYPKWASAVWEFDMSDGNQLIGYTQTYNYHPISQYALAVRGGEVAVPATVPVPKSAALLFIGIGFFGLAELWKRRKLNLA